MKKLKSLSVYCGAQTGADPVYRETAAKLGQILAENHIRLIFGGGDVGLMGVIADSVLAAGGKVTGIIPKFLVDVEVGHRRVTEFVVVGSMHERKQKMFELSDGFVVLPGGLGTLDEAIEIITWRQLHLHDKPIAIVDIAGYWKELLALIDHVIERKFANPDILDLFTVVARPEDVIDALAQAPSGAVRARPARV